MGRANNTSRSLIIISKAQGWDPTQIEGTPIVPGMTQYPEDRVTKGEQLHGPLPTSPQSSVPSVSAPKPTGGPTPTVRHGNPYAGK